MLELHPTAMAHGGEAVARKDGKAHFIAGAMPGEVVEAAVTEDRGSWARARLVSVLDASPDRREPPCPHARLCGGCQWQHTDRSTQLEWKRDIVASQLSHLGRIEEPPVNDTLDPGPALGYRNRMDFHVIDGRPGLMRHRSNDVVPLDSCPLLDPMLQPVFDNLGDLTNVDRITLRCGTRTGDILIIVEGELPPHAESWGAPVLQRQGKRLVPVIGEPKFAEVVDGTRFTIPFGGFFQNNTHGADALVQIVRAAADISEDETLLDGYCGVGLFGATVGADAELVLGIDSVTDAVEQARTNLDRAGINSYLVTGSFTKDIERLDAYWDVAIVDPPRKGLGERGVDAVTSTLPRRIVYVACDPASLARDSRILGGVGYDLVEATPIDMFPQTYHVEVVATFDRKPLGDEG
ncbi:MAG: class I SAM-dependent RNA methyltransferase [Acidimicrobiia bacterium]